MISLKASLSQEALSEKYKKSAEFGVCENDLQWKYVIGYITVYNVKHLNKLFGLRFELITCYN